MTRRNHPDMWLSPTPDPAPNRGRDSEGDHTDIEVSYSGGRAFRRETTRDDPDTTLTPADRQLMAQRSAEAACEWLAARDRALAGLREVLNLEWSHVDFERGLLRLPDSKTGKKTIVLGGAALLLLEGLPRAGRFVIASTSAGSKDERPRSDLNRPWRAVREAAGLPELRLHDLRHSAAAVGAGAGLSLHQIGGLLGHTQARTTAKYAHLAADPQRRAADLIGNEVAAALGLGANVVPIDGGKRGKRA